jgi:hypothetical protein
MQRYIAFLLLPVLGAAIPVWPYNNHWSYGPALAVAFLLVVNLLVVLTEIFGRRQDESLLEHRGVPADVAVSPDPGARHAERVEAPEIDPARGGGKAGNPVTGLG